MAAPRNASPGVGFGRAAVFCFPVSFNATIGVDATLVFAGDWANDKKRLKSWKNAKVIDGFSERSVVVWNPVGNGRCYGSRMNS